MKPVCMLVQGISDHLQGNKFYRKSVNVYIFLENVVKKNIERFILFFNLSFKTFKKRFFSEYLWEFKFQNIIKNIFVKILYDM